MSKGQPRIVRPNYAPSPSLSPAIRPRSRSQPALQAPLQPPCTGLLFALLGSPEPSFPPFPDCLLPPPPSHTFPPLAVTMLLPGPPSFPPSPPVSSHRLSRQDFFPPVEDTFFICSAVLSFSCFLTSWTKKNANRKIKGFSARITEVYLVFPHCYERTSLFVSTCFGERVDRPSLLLPRRLQAECFSF